MCSRNDDSTGWLHPGDPGFPYEEVAYLPTIELRDGSEAVLLEDLEMERAEFKRGEMQAVRDLMCNHDIAAIEAEAVADYRASLAAKADDVRYAGGNGTSDYWRGFNDGIDRLAERLIEGDTDARER